MIGANQNTQYADCSSMDGNEIQSIFHTAAEQGNIEFNYIQGFKQILNQVIGPYVFEIDNIVCGKCSISPKFNSADVYFQKLEIFFVI